MSETIALAPQESALTRYAQAFYAKVKAVKARIVALVGDNETPVTDEGAVRKAARLLLAVPKWLGHGVVALTRIALWAVNAVVGAVALGVALAAITIAAAIAIITLAAYKVVQLFSLILRTPYLMVRGDDCLKTDWVGYANLWKPKYFLCVSISQVFRAQIAERDAKSEAKDRHPAGSETPALSVVADRSKSEATPKQQKTYPARIPTLVEA